MRCGMDIHYTCDIDSDVVRAMIPHHGGAIERGRSARALSTDQKIRKLAEDIVSTQGTEIVSMEAFLKRRTVAKVP